MSEAASEHILEQAEILLRQCLGRWLWEVCVVAWGGRVILRGQARTYYAKQLAQHYVMNGLGLPVVANEIEVHQTPPVQDPAAPA